MGFTSSKAFAPFRKGRRRVVKERYIYNIYNIDPQAAKTPANPWENDVFQKNPTDFGVLTGPGRQITGGGGITGGKQQLSKSLERAGTSPSIGPEHSRSTICSTRMPHTLQTYSSVVALGLNWHNILDRDLPKILNQEFIVVNDPTVIDNPVGITRHNKINPINLIVGQPRLRSSLGERQSCTACYL